MNIQERPRPPTQIVLEPAALLNVGKETLAPSEDSNTPSLENGSSAVRHTQPKAEPNPLVASPSAPADRRPRRLPWGALLQRVFAVDAFACPRCGSRMRSLAAIERPDAIRAVLRCLGLPARAPPLAPAKPDPATGVLDFDDLPILER